MTASQTFESVNYTDCICSNNLSIQNTTGFAKFLPTCLLEYETWHPQAARLYNCRIGISFNAMFQFMLGLEVSC